MLGVYYISYPPRVAYLNRWPLSQPVRYKLLIGQHSGAHPGQIGDVVHQMNQTQECPGLSIFVEPVVPADAGQGPSTLVCYGSDRVINSHSGPASKECGSKISGKEKESHIAGYTEEKHNAFHRL